MILSRLLRLSLFGVALPLGLSCAAQPVPTEAPSEAAKAPPAQEDITSGDAISPVEAALAGSHRDPANRARDGQRHPEATLSFFGLSPQMTVVELWPGAGWYTEVLAATIQGHGKLITTNFDVNASTDPEDYRVRVGKAFAAKLKSDPVYEDVVAITVTDPNNLTLAPEGSVDLVLTF
ncbi:MAG TPA: methyltransferase, partial [Nannocystis exedens]|nr:methyltransferase [Nannocystis exedens]